MSDRIDTADVIHAPSPTSAGVDNGPFKQHTLCGNALRGFSDDITTPNIETFERIADTDERCCWECRSML